MFERECIVVNMFIIRKMMLVMMMKVSRVVVMK